MNCRLKISGFFVVFGLSVYSNQSLAILPIVYDPYDVFQNTITAKNSVQSLLNQAKQLQSDIENLKKLSKGHFENTTMVLNQLADITRQGQSLSYSTNHLDAVFKNKFSGLCPSSDYHQDFTRWSDTTYDTLKNSMHSMSMQGQLFDKENETIHELETLSENSGGNLAAQQTSHRIALHEISQLQKVRQILLNQASTQNTYMAYQLQKEQSQQASMHEWINNSQIAFRKYKGDEGFGSDETPRLP